MKKIPFTKFQLALEAISLFLLLYFGWFLLSSWESIPNKVPTHYNSAGIPDSWGGKKILIILFFVCLSVYLLVTVISFFPKSWNVPVAVTPENEQFVYTNMRGMLCFIKFFIMAFFVYISIRSAQGNSLGAWSILAGVLAIFGSIAYYILKTVLGAKKLSS